MTSAVPVIDIADPNAPGRIDHACRRVGFFVATGHTVPSSVTRAAWDAAREFFDLPIETRMKVHTASSPYGYEPMRHESLARTTDHGSGEHAPDPKQSLNVGPPDRGPGSGFGSYERVWPTEPYRLRVTWLAYYAEMERLSSRLLALFAESMGLARDHFEPFVDRHLGALRALDYPAGRDRHAVRAGAHADYGTLTVLRADPDVGGLEVADPDGGWLAVPSVSDGFVINIGDLMHRWTNGRWRSALHRALGDPAGRRRSSMAFFHNPNWDARIEPILLTPDEGLNFEPVVAGPWIQAKVERAT